jgi:hypothetical protein
MMAAPSAFAGTRRFEAIRHLGTGGMGTVFEVFDRERQARVALKTLRRPGPDALLHLKNEFRSLQDVRHVNLVNLLELIEDEGRWFVTMELVDGVDLLSHARPGHSDVTVSGMTETARVDVGAPAVSPATPAPLPDSADCCDVDRLRHALVQLARGLCALHDAGKVHRDVKPSNVVVDRAGRVVLVDFGLAAPTEGVEFDTETRGVGTRAYMAPEQAAGQRVSSAADWYSVGVVLYQAMTGDLPYRGAEIARRKAHESLARVRERWPDAPEDLASLCDDLLELDPATRPTGRDVLRRLGQAELQVTASAPFVGRSAELAALELALADASERAVTAMVVGDSGVGKSALVRELIARREHTDLVLTGRCYERELVPYKAFDGIADALSNFLRRQSSEQLERFIPREAAVLVRVFPTLARVPALAEAPAPATTDPYELRVVAFSALRSLFHSIAGGQRVLLSIDDLQWADADSNLLLAELLREPGAPRLCLVVTARPPAEGALDRVAALADRLGDVRHVALDPLSYDDAVRLAATALGPSGDQGLAGAIADETAGHPLFVLALAQHADAMVQLGRGLLKLDDALWARAEAVDEPARRLLELIAVATSPLPAALTIHAAGVGHESYLASESTLRVARLVRATTGEREGRIEPYHDRVRETVVARLDPERLRDCHLRLANAMEATGHATHDPQALVRHLEGAGRGQRAADQALLAATRALESLAFDQAAELLRTSLRLGDYEEVTRQKLRVQLADALTNAGRAADASSAYLDCAAHAESQSRLDYRRRAADHMLRSGHPAEGMSILSEVLRELGETVPTRRRALFGTLGRRLLARVRGLSWTPRSVSDIAPELLQRIDAFHAVGVSLALMDPVRGSTFEARALALALDAGDPIRLVPCMIMEAGYRGATGARGLTSGRRLAEEARRIADRTGDAYGIGTCRLIDGFLDYHAGAFDRAARLLRDVEQEFRRLPGTYFEQVFCHCFRLICLRNRGQLGELSRGFFDWVRDAERRGDFFTEASVRFNLNNVWLARDEPAEARRDLERTTWTPPEGGFHLQHWYEELARAEVDLYERAGEDGLARFRPIFAELSRSFILRMHLHRSIARWLLGRLIVAAARTAKEPGPLLDEASKLEKRLASEQFPYARTYSLLLRSAVAYRRADTVEATRLLEATIREADASDLPHCANAARYRLGKITAGPRGAELVRTARAWMEGEQIKNPVQMADVWAPGFD